MANTDTIKMISAYNQEASPTLFLSGMFDSPPENFHSTEDIEIDITRSEEDVAIVVTDLSTGYRDNSTDIYTNKRFKPPIFKEAGPLNAYDLIKRGAGQNPYADPNYQAEAIVRAFRLFRKLEAKIRRSMELMASQVLTTGIITQIDASGNTLYSLDYAPKATHFPTSGTAWDAGGSTKVQDLISLSEVLRSDGLHDPDTLIFSPENWELFMTDVDVVARLNLIDARIGSIDRMRSPGSGGNFRGTFDIGSYKFDCWTYGGRYKHPQTGTVTRFVPAANVIMMSSTARLDATFGAIPNFGTVDGRVMPFLPSRMSNSRGGMDLHTNAWITPDNEQLFVGVGARPLMIPTAIDTYGCLDSNI